MPKPITGTISGSRASAILGFSKYTTPFSVWQDIMEEREPGFNQKNGYDYQPFEGNAATRFGHAFESAAIEITELKTGKKIVDQEKIYKKKIGVVNTSCHIDGRLSGTKSMYEGKTSYERGFNLNWGDPGTDKIPREYHGQAQHNMYLSGCEETVFSVLVFPRTPFEWEEMGFVAEHPEECFGNFTIAKFEGSEFKYRFDPKKWAFPLSEMGYHHIYRVKLNDQLISKMHEKYREFWESYVLTGTPPKPMNVDDIKKLIPNPAGTIVIKNSFLIKTLKEYTEITKEIGGSGILSKRKEQLKTVFLDRVRKQIPVADEESTDKWIFLDEQGNKLGSWGKNKNGTFILYTN